jgi:AcrR family transcriptional regulator
VSELAVEAAVGAERSARLVEILDAAESIVEAVGIDALTMRKLAGDVGIRAPSLYKHVRDKSELLAMLQERALESVGAVMAQASDLASLGQAYRGWALAHPAMYELTCRRPLERDRLEPGIEDAAAAPVIALAGGDEHRARALWAAAHGLVDLELADRFPEGADLDAAWAALTDAFS